MEQWRGSVCPAAELAHSQPREEARQCQASLGGSSIRLLWGRATVETTEARKLSKAT